MVDIADLVYSVCLNLDGFEKRQQMQALYLSQFVADCIRTDIPKLSFVRRGQPRIVRIFLISQLSMMRVVSFGDLRRTYNTSIGLFSELT